MLRRAMFRLDRTQLLPEPGVVVLLGGEPPQSPELLGLVRQAAFVAAADAGAAVALAAGRAPDLLVGDFDSLDVNLLAACQMGDTEIVRLPVRKDMTDGEFLMQRLLQRAGERGWRRLLVLGALGGRTDQTLANIFCALPLARAGLELCFAGDQGGGLELLALAAAGDNAAKPVKADIKENIKDNLKDDTNNDVNNNEKTGGAEEAQRNAPGARLLRLYGFKGCAASLLALEGDVSRVELAGFDYPLAGRLAANVSLGLSNTVKRQQADIRLWGGALLVCLQDSRFSG